MQTFKLSKAIVRDNDTIRVSVTTIPDEQKQVYSFDAKKMKTVHPFFSVAINDKTEKLLIVVRKKSFSKKDPIIASAVINGGQFPIKLNDQNNMGMKTISLLEPICQQPDDNSKSSSKREVVGKIVLQFIITKELSCQKGVNKSLFFKKKISNGYSKIGALLDDKEKGEGNFLFSPITN